MSKSNFTTLYGVNVRDKVEKKGGLDYLSWANAWAELQTHCPGAKRTVYEDPATGWNYFSDGRTGWVKVGITIDDIEHIDYLPIMDYKNRPIAVENITSFEVNKTIQRSTTKAIGMHGLGLSLWTGEDLVDSPTEKAPKTTPARPITTPTMIDLNIGDDNWSKVLTYISANKDQGLAVIGKQLAKKYNMTNEVKLAVKEAVNG